MYARDSVLCKQVLELGVMRREHVADGTNVGQGKYQFPILSKLESCN